MWPHGSKDKKEARTHVQPKAHRGHYNLKEPLDSSQRSPDLRKRPLGSYMASEALYDFRKRIEPLCSLGRIGIITSLRTSGFPCNLRVQIQTYGSRYNLQI